MGEKVVKIIIITLLSTILFLSLGMIYYFVFRSANEKSQNLPSNQNNNENLFPSSQNQNLNNQLTSISGKNTTQATTTSSEKPLVSALDVKVINDKPSTKPIFIERDDPITKSKSLWLRYMERGTGHIFDFSVSDQTIREISDNTLTMVYDTFWGNNGQNVLVRESNADGTTRALGGVITSQSASSTSSITVGQLITSELSSIPEEAAISPDESKIFYISPVANDFVGYIGTFNKKLPEIKGVEIFSSPIGRWRISWPALNTISLYTSPSQDVDGLLYFLNTKNGAFEKILGNIPGLTASVSSDGKNVLYSESSSQNGVATHIYNLAKQTTYDFPIKTLPDDKCVWSKSDFNKVYCAVPVEIPAGKYPDNWYDGTIHFNDRIVSIDIKSQVVQDIADQSIFKDLGGIDVEKMVLSPNENYISILNKKDETLLLLKLY